MQEYVNMWVHMRSREVEREGKGERGVGKREEKGGERVRGEGGRERERCVLYDSYRGKKSHGDPLN